MNDVTAGSGTKSSNEIGVVLSTKMIETVNVPIQPLLVRFAVPEAWFLPGVKSAEPDDEAVTA